MKILHVAYIYPPTLNVADGITNVIYNFTKELSRKGYKVTVYTSNLLDLYNNEVLCTGNLIVNGVIVYYLRFLWRYKTFIITPSIIPLLHKHIKNFDIIHIHDCRSFQGISAYLFAKKYKIPYVFQPHGSYLYSLPQSSYLKIAKLVLDKLISVKIFKNASKIIALSEVEAQQYRSMGVPDAKIAVIPNGIDLSEYAVLPPKGSFKRKFDIPDHKKIVLYLGRIHKTKGVDLLVKAYSYLTKEMKRNDALLVIAGPDDGYLSEVKSLVASLGISNSVLFTGFISSEDKLSALVDADVFVTPSFYGFPVTFLEACATGTPIITTSLGDTLEWIDGNVGYVTQPTQEDLAKAICSVINNRDLQQKFSRNCKELVRSKFSMNAVVSKLEQTYEGIIRN